jgi:hypothetical protein
VHREPGAGPLSLHISQRISTTALSNGSLLQVLVALLLRLGADVRARSLLGKSTPLHYAAQRGQLEVPTHSIARSPRD